MLRHVQHAVRNARAYSQQLVVDSPVAQAQYPYFVRRNPRGSLPVYSHTRNAGTRVLVEIRNVEGHVDSLVSDLQRSLFPPDSPEASRLKVQIRQQRHLLVGGGRWRKEVVEWLTSKGF